MKRPAHIVIERLDLTASGLSRRLNRVLARMGHAVMEAMVHDLVVSAVVVEFPHAETV